MDIFDDHIDKVNNPRSKKYLPEDTNIHAMGMGGDGLIAYYKEKFFGIKRTQIVKPTSVKKVVKKKESVNKSDLKKAIKKQKQFLNGKVDKSFW